MNQKLRISIIIISILTLSVITYLQYQSANPVMTVFSALRSYGKQSSVTIYNYNTNQTYTIHQNMKDEYAEIYFQTDEFTNKHIYIYSQTQISQTFLNDNCINEELSSLPENPFALYRNISDMKIEESTIESILHFFMNADKNIASKDSIINKAMVKETVSKLIHYLNEENRISSVKSKNGNNTIYKLEIENIQSFINDLLKIASDMFYQNIKESMLDSISSQIGNNKLIINISFNRLRQFRCAEIYIDNDLLYTIKAR